MPRLTSPFECASGSLLALLAESPKAANVPDSRLDAAASEVAGRPVYIHCETDEAAWVELTRAVVAVPGQHVEGFADINVAAA